MVRALLVFFLFSCVLHFTPLVKIFSPVCSFPFCSFWVGITRDRWNTFTNIHWIRGQFQFFFFFSFNRIILSSSLESHTHIMSAQSQLTIKLYKKLTNTMCVCVCVDCWFRSFYHSAFDYCIIFAIMRFYVTYFFFIFSFICKYLFKITGLCLKCLNDRRLATLWLDNYGPTIC